MYSVTDDHKRIMSRLFSSVPVADAAYTQYKALSGRVAVWNVPFEDRSPTFIRAHGVNTAGHSEEMLDLRTVSFPVRQDGVLVMKKQEIQTVVTSFVADYQMRAKLTLWRAPTAKVNGGWCMCMMKQEYDGPKVRG
jgi:hypothetical protein